MKKRYLLLFALIIAVMQGCQNNGYIGRYFGTWRFDSYSVDGEEITEFEIRYDDRDFIVPLENITMSFQGTVVSIVTVLDEYSDFTGRKGSWSEDGDQLTLNFTHYDDKTGEPGKADYAAPSWLGMTSKAPMVMTTSNNKNDSFTLTWIDPEGGQVRVYKMHKTW